MLLPPAMADIALASSGSSNHMGGSGSWLQWRSSGQAAGPLPPARHVGFLAAAVAPQLAAGPPCGTHQQQSEPAAGATATGTSSSSLVAADHELQLWRLGVGLTPAGLEVVAATHAENVARRGVQQQLLEVLTWLVPHWVPHLVPGVTGVTVRSDTADGDPWSNHKAGAPGGQPEGLSAGFDAAQLYRAVKPRGNEPQLLTTPPELQPQLRPYQRRAVYWMLQREGCTAICGTPSAQELGHPLWAPVQLLPDRQPGVSPPPLTHLPQQPGSGNNESGEGTLPGGAPRCLWLNPYSGLLSAEGFAAPPPVSGGILAEQMGLGKTVELLATIMCHRWPGPTPAAAAAAEAEEEEQHGLHTVTDGKGDATKSAAAAVAADAGDAQMLGGGKDSSPLTSAQQGGQGTHRGSSRKRGVQQQDSGPGAPGCCVTCGARVWDPVHLPPHVGEGHGGAKRRRSTRGHTAAAAGGGGSGSRHQQQQHQGLQCSHCLRQEALTRVEECGTTLIVVPPAILNQVGCVECVW